MNVCFDYPRFLTHGIYDAYLDLTELNESLLFILFLLFPDSFILVLLICFTCFEFKLQKALLIFFFHVDSYGWSDIELWRFSLLLIFLLPTFLSLFPWTSDTFSLISSNQRSWENLRDSCQKSLAFFASWSAASCSLSWLRMAHNCKWNLVLYRSLIKCSASLLLFANFSILSVCK